MWFFQLMRRRGIYMDPAGGDGGSSGGGGGNGSGDGGGSSGSGSNGGSGSGAGGGGDGSSAKGSGGSSGAAGGKAGESGGEASKGSGTGGSGTGGKGGESGTGGAGDKSSEGDAGKGAAGKGGAGGKSQAAATEVPENWRELYAQGDEKKLAQLKRYPSYKAAMDALFDAKGRISRGEVSKVLGDKPTEEEIAEYRKANGIPEKADGYKLELSDGNEITEESKPAIDKMLEVLHKNHVSPKVASAVVDTLFALQEGEENDRKEFDRSAIQSFNDEMRPEWGSDYKRNVKILKTYFESMPDGIGEDMMQARMPDGTPFASHPAAMRWLLNVALEQNPLSTVVEDGGDASMTRVTDELAKLEKMMGDHTSEYWKGSKSESHQARYRELLDAKMRATRKAA